MLFGRLALQAAHTPIETLVIFFIVGTLAYSHLQLQRPARVDDIHFDIRDPSLVCYRPKSTGQCFTFQNMIAFQPTPTLFTRFISLARIADSLDLLLILLGYILMCITSLLLYSRSRSLGSSFFLPLAIVSSALLSFLIALPIAVAFKIPIDPVALTWALPFVVSTIGFDKPLRLARVVFLHPHLIPPLKPASIESLSQVYPPIIRDYTIEVAVLTLGASSRIGGLREICTLTALILAIDCLLMCTYFTAILAVMVQVRKIRPLSTSPTPDAHYFTRIFSFLLGEKGASYYKLITSSVKGKIKENTVARLKLFLITSFLVLHILNFITPLTLSNDTNVISHKVDLSPSVGVMLAALAEAEGLSAQERGMVHPPARSSSSDFSLLSTPKSESKSSFTLFNRFVLPWSHPVLSKSVLVMLTLSVLLNGYLLRGVTFVRNAQVVKKTERPHSRESEEKAGGSPKPSPIRSLEECIDIFENGPSPRSLRMELLTNEEVILLVQIGKIATYALEIVLGTNSLVTLERAVQIRRALISRTRTLKTSAIPYDYSRVFNACCENVVGYVPLPLEIAGPLLIDSVPFPIPMATADRTLVASTSLGCKVLNLGGGVQMVIARDAMTRGPMVEFPGVLEAVEALRWVESEEGLGVLRGAFEGTDRFVRLVGVKCAMAERLLYMRFKSTTGDVVGMDTVSKGTKKALEAMSGVFPSMSVLTLSNDYTTDKEQTVINRIEEQGKSVVAVAVVPGEVVRTVLKTSVGELVRLNNPVGDAVTGGVGRFNANAANVLTAMYHATGQDFAQNMESLHCLTLMEAILSPTSTDLLLTLTMTCIELGSIGVTASLLSQSSVLEMLGFKGEHPTDPEAHARQLARVLAGGVMASQLGFFGALCEVESGSEA